MNGKVLMNKAYDAIIIGAGIIGASIAFELAKKVLRDTQRRQTWGGWSRFYRQHLRRHPDALLTPRRHGDGVRKLPALETVGRTRPGCRGRAWLRGVPRDQSRNALRATPPTCRCTSISIASSTSRSNSGISIRCRKSSRLSTSMPIIRRAALTMTSSARHPARR